MQTGGDGEGGGDSGGGKGEGCDGEGDGSGGRGGAGEGGGARGRKSALPMLAQAHQLPSALWMTMERPRTDMSPESGRVSLIRWGQWSLNREQLLVI